MTHSEIVAYLEAQATAAGAASFWHGKQAQANINYNAAFPQAHLFLMPSRLKGGHITTQVAMCFYGLDKHENGSADSIFIQDAIDRLTQQFHGILSAEVQPELVDDEMKRVPVLRQGPGIGTGYLVNFSLQTLVVC